MSVEQLEHTTDRWDALQAYTREVFGAQDEQLRTLMPRAIAAGIPDIAVDASVGRLLRTLCAMTNAGKGAAVAIELGTLAGYSAIWIARGLRRDPAGRLYTIEPEPHHANFALREFSAAGVADRIEIRRSTALEELPRLRDQLGDESVDFAFLDAIKTEYTDYLLALRPMMRRGGLIVADNVLGGSKWVTDPPGSSDYRDAIDRFNRTVASDSWFETSCVPLREGLMIARRLD